MNIRDGFASHYIDQVSVSNELAVRILLAAEDRLRINLQFVLMWVVNPFEIAGENYDKQDTE